MQMQSIGVVGCGIMGSGIAQICAQYGYTVFVSEKEVSILDKGLLAIRTTFEKMVSGGRLSTGEMKEIRGRIHGATNLDHLEQCDLVIEAVTENLELKKRIFASLDTTCKPTAILATNTSVLPVIEIARATSRPGKVLGTHFLTPPPVIKLLEVVRSVATSPETLEATRRFGESIGKKIVIAEDRPGFIVNRILTSILFNAVRLLEEGVASKEDIDTAIQVGLGLPMGAFQLIDLIGMDTILSGSSAMFEELNDPQYFCPITMRRMVAAGMLGRKTGEGFYQYLNKF